MKLVVCSFIKKQMKKAIKILFKIAISLTISLLVTSYFLEKDVINFTMSQENTNLFSTASNNNFKIYNNNKLVVGDIKTLNIKIINNGNSELLNEEVRIPFTIHIPDNLNLIDYQIINKKNQNISKYELVNKTNSIHINWNHFDPSSIIEIQLVYTGSSKNIKIQGSYLDGEISKIGYFSRSLTNNLNLQLIGILVIALLFMLAIIVILFEIKIPNWIVFLILFISIYWATNVIINLYFIYTY